MKRAINIIIVPSPSGGVHATAGILDQTGETRYTWQRTLLDKTWLGISADVPNAGVMLWALQCARALARAMEEALYDDPSASVSFPYAPPPEH